VGEMRKGSDIHSPGSIPGIFPLHSADDPNESDQKSHLRCLFSTNSSLRDFIFMPNPDKPEKCLK